MRLTELATSRTSGALSVGLAEVLDRVAHRREHYVARTSSAATRPPAIAARARARDHLLAVRRADRVDAARLRARAGADRAAAPPAARAATRRPRRSPGRGEADTARRAGDGRRSVSLIVAAHDEQEVIAAKVANALALDYPRERLEVIVACDGCSRRDRRARPRGRRRPRARAAARRQDPRPGRGRRARARRARRLLRRQRAAGSPTRCARSSARSPTRASATPAGRSASCRRAAAPRADNQEGVYWRYEMAVRALESRLSLDHGRQRRDLRDPPRRLHRRRPDHGPRPVAAVQHGQARPARGLRARRRARARRWCPRSRGEFARKRRMMSHTWPIVLRGGMLSPRGYPPGYALMIFSHRAAALRTPGAARARARRQRRARRRRRGPAVRRSRSRCSWRCCAAALLAGARPRRGRC